MNAVTEPKIPIVLRCASSTDDVASESNERSEVEHAAWYPSAAATYHHHNGWPGRNLKPFLSIIFRIPREFLKAKYISIGLSLSVCMQCTRRFVAQTNIFI